MRARVVFPLLVVLLLASVGAGDTSNAGPRASPQQLPRFGCVRRADRATVLWFRARDGTRLAGVLLGRGRTGVVLAHQLNNNACAWLPFARALRRQGMRVLAFNFRGYRPSARRRALRFSRLAGDVAGAVAALRRRGARRIFLVGASMGGTATLVAAPRLAQPPAGVVTLSAPSTYRGMNALAALRRLRSPVLFLVARNDIAFVDDARRMLRAARSEKRLRLVRGSRHGTELMSGRRGARVRRLVEAFIRDQLAR